MSEEMVVRQCAPTLAGIKAGSLFPCPCTDRDALLDEVRQLNRRLSPKGLCLLPLRFTEGSALLYLYRPATLRRDLSDDLARRLLAEAGYDGGSCGRCVATLIRRFRQGADFPHEIGLFLGYPPEDVAGFMTHRGKNCKCVGCWKVYGDEYAARRRFAAYQSCTANYCRRRAGGASLEGLTVSRLPQ